MTYVSKLNTRAPLDRSPKKNEVERRGGLPMYIRRIANHLHAEKGMTIGHAIATAKNAAAKMCASGDLNFHGKQNVNAGSRAEACAAIEDWNARIKGSGVSKHRGITTQVQRDADYIEYILKNDSHGISKNGFNPRQPRNALGMWSKHQKRVYDASRARGMSVSQATEFANKAPKNKPRNKVSKLSDEEFAELSKWIDDPDDPDTVEFDLKGEITKLDAEQQLVFGWASVAKLADGEQVVDKQGDVLDDLDQVEKVAYDFVLNCRDGGEMHVRKGVSTMVESFVSTPEKREKMGIPEGVIPDGWWVGFKISDKEVWKSVTSGKYKMFSVHGSGTRKAYDGD